MNTEIWGISPLAFHEAGHVAVHYWAGHSIEYATIVSDGEAAGSVNSDQSELVRLRFEADEVRQVRIERIIMASIVGVIGQRRHAPESVHQDDSDADHFAVGGWFDALDVPEGKFARFTGGYLNCEQRDL